MEIKMPQRRRDVIIAVSSCVLVAISLVFIVMTFRRPHYSNLQYFTVDDGQSYFGLPAPHFAPFEYQGKQAVQAMLFRGSDGKPFVGYLMKYSDSAQRSLAKAAESTDSEPQDTVRDEDRLFKRPGGGEWVSAANPTSAEIWEKVVDPKTGAPAPHWEGH